MNNIKYLPFALFLLFFAFAGCNKQENDSTPKSISLDAPVMDKTEKQSLATQNDATGRSEVTNVDFKQIDNTFTTQSRMIIKTGTMSIESDSYNDAESKIKTIASKYSGYTTNSSSNVNVNNKKQGS